MSFNPENILLGRSNVTREQIEWLSARTGSDYVTTQAGLLALPDDCVCCDECSEYVTTDEAIEVGSRRNRKVFCESCADRETFKCADCGEYVLNDNSGGCNTSDETVCQSCSESYFNCNGCDSTCSENDYGEDGQCRSCCAENDGSVIADYNKRVTCSPVGKGPHFFGVELEVEAKDREASAEKVAAAVDGFAILKEDGSLDSGFEIVTRPASLEKQVEGWSRFFAHGTSGLSSFSTETCGLHVHCSRAPLTQLAIAKVVCFVNAEANRNFIERIAGRRSGKWAQICNKRLADGAKRNLERYEAVNLQNAGTIEFRIFKGTLKKESLFKAVEFCDALIRWCQYGQTGLTDCLRLEGFLRYVADGRRAWPHLNAFIDAKWLGLVTKATQVMGYTSAPVKTELGFNVSVSTPGDESADSNATSN